MRISVSERDCRVAGAPRNDGKWPHSELRNRAEGRRSYNMWMINLAESSRLRGPSAYQIKWIFREALKSSQVRRRISIW